MTDVLKGTTRRALAAFAAIAIALTVTGFTVVGTASAASADEVGVMAPSCSTGRGSDEGGIRYAWARCLSSPPERYQFRLKWSCTHDSAVRFGAWSYADGLRNYGYCPLGETVDQNGFEWR